MLFSLIKERRKRVFLKKSALKFCSNKKYAYLCIAFSDKAIR